MLTELVRSLAYVLPTNHDVFATPLTTTVRQGFLSVPTHCPSSFSATVSLHAGDRIKFGPLGWNVTYSFGDSDLDAAFKLLGRFVDDLHIDTSTATLASLPVESLVYVTGNITYGGWVTDEWDRRCLLAILDHFYSASIFGDAVSEFIAE